MMADINKQTYKHQLVDEILWNDWDPIRVNNVPEARDEYRSYVSKIVAFKTAGAQCETIAQYLFQIETDQMGLNGNLENCRRVSQIIISLVV